ncbi:succinylglutamate desuccinylase/aspartoacylase family protein [Patescibacteria group bacterium]
MKTTNYKIGTVGTLEISLPIIELGSGQPRGTIISLQHGGELSSILINKLLVEREKSIIGTIRLLPVANPFGLIQDSRVDPIDNKNINRQFPGRADGDFTARLSAALFELCQASDFVLDLHNFSQRQSPLLAGYAQISKEKKDAEINKLISLLKPDAVWQVDTKRQQDQRYNGALDEVLATNNIPSIFIEMPNINLINQSMIDRVADGIQNIFNNFQNPFIGKGNIPEFNANYLYADQAGLFESTIKPLTNIVIGETLGTVHNLKNFKKTEIKSHLSGTVLSVLGRGVIRTGSKLASIGTRI